MTHPVLFALLVLPVATALACRWLGQPKQRDRFHVAGSCATALAGWTLAAAVFSDGQPVLAAGEFLAVDALSAYMVTLVVTIALLAGLHSPAYLRNDVAHGGLPEARTAEYYLWFHLFVATMLLVVTVNVVAV